MDIFGGPLCSPPRGVIALSTSTLALALLPSCAVPSPGKHTPPKRLVSPGWPLHQYRPLSKSKVLAMAGLCFLGLAFVLVKFSILLPRLVEKPSF